MLNSGFGSLGWCIQPSNPSIQPSKQSDQHMPQRHILTPDIGHQEHALVQELRLGAQHGHALCGEGVAVRCDNFRGARPFLFGELRDPCKKKGGQELDYIYISTYMVCAASCLRRQGMQAWRSRLEPVDQGNARLKLIEAACSWPVCS